MVLFYNLMGPPSYMRSIVDRKVVKRRMTIHDHSTENNDLSIQFLYFTSRNTQYTQRHNTVQISCTEEKTTPFTLHWIHRVDRSIYRVPQNAAGCHRCWQVSSRYGQAKVFHVSFITRGPQLVVVKCFLEWSFVVLAAKCTQAPGTVVVLEGQDSKTCTKW